MGNRSRIEKYIADEELPQFFRELADALEKGADGEFACAADFKKFKIKVRNEFGKIHVRAKFKALSECTPSADIIGDVGVEATSASLQTRPKYKALKERMKASFRMIFKMIHADEIPPREAMDSFMADSHLMVTYEGYGDEFYDVYIEACEALEKAYEAGDLVRMNEAVDQIAFQKGHCHGKYD